MTCRIYAWPRFAAFIFITLAAVMSSVPVTRADCGCSSHNGSGCGASECDGCSNCNGCATRTLEGGEAGEGGEGGEGGDTLSSDLNIDETFAAFTGSDFAVSDMGNDGGGYIDYAVVGNFLRFRADAAYNNPVPDRAEFFYAQCGILPGGRGPQGIETNVDYQEASPYLELALTRRFSGFIETPIRAINPEVNANHAGMADLMTGFKYALIACPDEYLTVQFKVYAPTGDPAKGLGTGHVSLEPGVLYYLRWSDRVTLFGELRDWIPISDSQANGSDFAGNVLRYGVGSGYDIFNCSTRYDSERLTAVGELVGWSILGGQGTDENGNAFSASGDTIVNGKVGLRYSCDGHSVYGGVGKALSGDTWYEDILRFEYRYAF